MPTFSHTSNVWTVGLTHQEAEGVEGLLGIIAASAAPVPGAGPIVSAAVGVAGGVILMVDAIGGDKGVDVSGAIGTTGVVVVPKGSSIVALLVQAAEFPINPEATIVDLIIKVGGKNPGFASELGIATVSGVAVAVLAGTPLGWALAAANIGGAIVKLFEPAPNPNQHGGVRADRTAVGPWERFIMAKVSKQNNVSILSWQGLFSADGGGGSGVYANRPQVGPWETWTLIDNHDGTFSFQSINGHYMTALNGGGEGSTCYSDRTQIGNWEKFFIQNLDTGHVCIKTHDKGTYVSVQQDL